MPDPKLAKELLARAYGTALQPLAPEWKQKADENVLVGGADVGENVPIINKIWPGGAHIPGAREVYNEGVRPMTSLLGLLSEGASRGRGQTSVPAVSIVRSPEGIILKEESASLLQRLLSRLKGGEPLENIPLADRQKAMGMEDVVYHGTKDSLVPRGLLVKDSNPREDYKFLKTNFGVDGDLGLHVDHDPKVAHNAIGATQLLPHEPVERGKYASADRLFKLKARIANPIELPDYGRWNDPYKVAQYSQKIWGRPRNQVEDQIFQEANDIIRKHGGGSRTGTILPSHFERVMEDWNTRFPEILQENGHDSVKYVNKIEGHGKHSTMLLEPNQVRMPWARFDPRKLLAGDLLAFNKKKLGPEEPSLGAAGQELKRLLKIRAAREGMEKLDEFTSGSGESEKRTTDIELK